MTLAGRQFSPLTKKDRRVGVAFVKAFSLQIKTKPLHMDAPEKYLTAVGVQ